MNSALLAKGDEMHSFARELFPICRSITGNGVRQTLREIQVHLPGLTVHEVPSGTQCFDWTVPPEWNIRDAYVLDPSGEKIIDFKRSNLHVVNYSVPVDCNLALEELQEHLHSRPDLPDAVPYVASYYRRDWGFCLTQRQRDSLVPGLYKAKIDSTLEPGALTYGELVLPGDTSQEIFFSTYVCHPSLGNNELSGPVVTTFLAKWLSSLRSRRFTYRVIFVPETIGAIAYLSRNLHHLKSAVVAGYNVTCVGDERCYSYLPSRQGSTLADVVAKHVLKHIDPHHLVYTFLDRGSDERQYCAPGVDLPVASIMRSKYAAYPEYHTSLDNLDLVTAAGLAGSLLSFQRCVTALEYCRKYNSEVLCEPQLGRRGLHSSMEDHNADAVLRIRMDLLAYCDGKRTLVEIADVIGVPVWHLVPFVEELLKHGLISEVS